MDASSLRGYHEFILRNVIDVGGTVPTHENAKDVIVSEVCWKHLSQRRSQRFQTWTHEMTL